MLYSSFEAHSFGPLARSLLTALALAGSVSCSSVTRPPDKAASDAGGDDSALPAKCVPALPDYKGPLCGPPDRPCNVLANEIVIGTHSTRYASPGIVVDDQGAPHVVASENGGEASNFGFYAHREGSGAWTAPEKTPFPVVAVSLVPGSSGTFFALINGGGGAASLQTRGPGGEWSAALPLPGALHAAPGGLACDSSGVFHASLGNPNFSLQYGRYQDHWIVDALNVKGAAPPPLAVSNNGTPAIVYWDAAKMADKKLYWKSYPGEPELVHTISAGDMLVTNAAIAFTMGPPDGANPDGRPHVLFSRPSSDTAIRKEIIYATRDGASGWRVSSPIDQEIHTSCSSDPPPLPGAICDHPYAEVSPIAVIVSRGGDVRLLYVKRIRNDVLIASCPNPPPATCQWVEQPESSVNSGDLYMAWVDDMGKVASTRLTQSLDVGGATATLDASGKIHVAVYDARMDGNTKPQNLDMVRYIQLGL
jgi:hypothetical protein